MSRSWSVKFFSDWMAIGGQRKSFHVQAAS